jgi:hypothetical protein
VFNSRVTNLKHNLMDQNIFAELLSYIHEYYPIGAPRLKTIQENKIRKKIVEKFEDQGKLNKQWQKVIGEFRKLGVSNVENMSYMDSPNLKASLDLDHEMEGIKVRKSLVVCISLLVPYYTYYYRYCHFVKSEVGYSQLGYWMFQTDKGFSYLKPSVDVEFIASTIQANFLDYSFIGHYPLMINKIQGGIPFGFDKVYYTPADYSYYQFLFDPHESTNDFDVRP